MWSDLDQEYRKQGLYVNKIPSSSQIIRVFHRSLLFIGRGGGDFGAQGLLLRLDMLLLQDFFLCALGAAALLTPDLFSSLSFGADPSGLDALNAVQKQASGQKAVQGLGAFLLAFDGKSRRDMDKINTGGGFVDLLTAGTGGADKCLSQIVFGDAQMVHARLKGGFFLGGNVEQAHGCGTLNRFDNLQRVDAVADKVYPVLLQDGRGFVDFVDAQNQDGFLAEPLGGRVDVVDVDIAVAQGLDDGIHTAWMAGDLHGNDRINRVFEIEAFQDRDGLIGVIHDQAQRADFIGARSRDRLGANAFFVQDVDQLRQGSGDVIQLYGNLHDRHNQAVPPAKSYPAVKAFRFISSRDFFFSPIIALRLFK